MTSDQLRIEATALTARSVRCEVIATELRTRAANLQDALDTAVALHTRSTWDSPTATTSRSVLEVHRVRLARAVEEIRDIAAALTAEGGNDRAAASALRRRADLVGVHPS